MKTFYSPPRLRTYLVYESFHVRGGFFDSVMTRSPPKPPILDIPFQYRPCALASRCSRRRAPLLGPSSLDSSACWKATPKPLSKWLDKSTSTGHHGPMQQQPRIGWRPMKETPPPPPPVRAKVRADLSRRELKSGVLLSGVDQRERRLGARRNIPEDP